MATRLFVSAGEASGDRHLGALLDHLEERIGPLEIAGLGGETLRRRGARPLAGLEELSVLGFAEVLPRLPFFHRLMGRCLDTLRTFRPRAVILVDYPGFNLRLGRRARAAGFPVIGYIAPQVWAWKRERRPGIRRAVDRLLVVFPFEEALFREAGIPATFVGHPLLDREPPGEEPETVRARLGVPSGRSLLALLPGSRSQEVRAILPTLVAGTASLGGEAVMAVSRRGDLDPGCYAPAREAGFGLWDGSAAALVEAADAALVASGTATLETGLAGTPLAVVYRTGWLNWQVARRVVSLKTVGLVNIAAGGDRVPELLQDALTPHAVEAVARRILFDPAEREQQRVYLSRLRERLGGEGSARRAAQEIARFLEERG